ncbi:uncharacterized protein EDB91DRAFT_11830 [Suillus paluster]|uniref:uncharacterized protein n=1 Tax=Suillus paluster TaxID=48578 RepID=UPI001B863E43|nr:uncharacterized protein EDB91DRAFT_11830 [Suillus paluster]KAG1756375.1 hypothetical protein EDB91DRAFT_11830 [Suillus paluster]
MVPSIDEVEEYFQSLERFLADSLTAASPDLPNIREAVHRLWVDISRFGPPGLSSFPDIHVPGLGAFEVPPRPPPPPLPRTLIEKTGDWITEHPWKSSGIAVTALGAGLLAGYTTFRMTHAHKRRLRSTTVTPEKRQVVVVLGGDHPLGLPLIIELEQKGYIVITSVSTPEAVGSIESKGHGYVRALVLDPNEPGTIPIFLRSLASTLSRRFPITAAGDPYAATHPLLHSIISLLTLPIPSIHTTPTPIEQLSLRSTYLPHLLSTHFAPLQTLQALLPLLRADAQRGRGRKSIIVCLPAADARVGLPFGGVSAMSAAATLRALDVLRREVAVAQGMDSIRIVAVDVGVVGETPVSGLANPHVMDDWTLSEKATYGPAFTALGETSMGQSRRPEDISVLINSIIGVVSAGTKTTTASKTICGIRVGVGYEKIRDWIRGDRFAVGAGGSLFSRLSTQKRELTIVVHAAGTYTFASFLPGVLLDRLLSLPHILVGIRNWLLPVPPAQPPTVPEVAPSVPSSTAVSLFLPSSASTSLTASSSPLAPRPSASEAAAPVLEQTEPLSEPEDISGHETGSEADLESNSGDGDASAVESSWVSLGSRGPTD